MPCADGHFILAAGNDGQFRRFCAFAGCPELAEDPRFATNSARSVNRRALYALLPEITLQKSREEWIEGLSGCNVPAGPVNDLAQVFSDPQVLARGMKQSVPYAGAAGGQVELIANPVRFSGTPVDTRHAPPRMGEHTEEVLKGVLGMEAGEIAALRDEGVV